MQYLTCRALTSGFDNGNGDGDGDGDGDGNGIVCCAAVLDGGFFISSQQGGWDGMGMGASFYPPSPRAPSPGYWLGGGGQ